MRLPYAEPYKIKMVEPLHPSARSDRETWIKEAKYNLFNLKSEQVFIDLLTDSGTGAMSDRQWSALMLGDESYAGASSYYRLKEKIREILGFDYFLPTHQGRAAENVLFSVLVNAGDLIPGNTHFDTTRGHIEFRKASAIDCSIDEAFNTSVDHPFKGNVDIRKLEQVFQENPVKKIPFIIITLTCNSSGGQPVSMANLKEIHRIGKENGTLVFYDGARFAENAYFIKTREEGYQDKTIKEIVLEMFSFADGMTMSSKKDAIVNMGGFIGFRDEQLFREATTFNIMFEGFITYGGMSGRDMNALAQGLDEGTEFDYLDSRIRQVAYLGERMKEYGIPVLKPFGGHAIFVDVKQFMTNVPLEQFPAQTLAVELYLEAGVRSAEIGILMADRDPVTRENRFPEMELLRLAIPRRVYTRNHMDVVAVAMKNIFDRRQELTSGLRIVREAPILRHFTVELEPVD